MARNIGFAAIVWLAFLGTASSSLSDLPPPEEARPETTRSWIMTKGGQKLSRETVSGSVDRGRWTLQSTANVSLAGAVATFEQTLIVDAENLSFVDYRLDVEMASGPQIIEAKATEGGVSFHVVAGGQDLDAEGSGAAPILCLDNMILAPYEVLGRMALGHDGPFEFTIAVPQVMKALPASFDPGAIVQIKVDDGLRRARHGKLRVASLLTEVWYDAEDGSPYRIYVPSQQLDATVDGWKGVVEPEPDSESKPETDEGSRDIELTLKSELGELPCSLTVPSSGEDPFPAVLLMAGSGPNDRDETLGPNKPFRDLAHGLGGAGIASLRCDKRTAILQAEIVQAMEAGAGQEDVATLLAQGANWTLREEYVVDALAALGYLAKREEIRGDALFVLGHSLGALAVPYVVAEFDATRGAILMAGAGRPFDVVLQEQLAFQSGLAGMSPEEAERSAATKVEPLLQLRDGKPEEMDRYMGATAVYWKDLLSRDAVAATAGLPVPTLLLQGGKDIQIREPDYKNLLAALASREGVSHTARLFPDLNHLFFAVEGESTGGEYYEAGTMDSQVPKTIARWIVSTIRP